MQRRKFICIAGAAVITAAGGTYLLSDKTDFIRSDIKPDLAGQIPFKPGEKEILYLASLAPSGHNTQPWFVKYVEPYHWIIGNDKSKWLPGVDPTQRETLLSIGAFLQNLEYAANTFGYNCQFSVLANTNQDENIVEVKLLKASNGATFNVEQIKLRRTVRSNYLNDPISKADIDHLSVENADYFHFIPNTTKEYKWLNEQTIEANRIQTNRDIAQQELANWIRFSGNDAEKNLDGLTTASMEIKGLPGWIVRNFYTREDVMKKSFRDQTIDKVKQQVEHSAGWLLITSNDNSVLSLLETGKRLQSLLLKIRQRSIAIHPMTQALEETSIMNTINRSVGIINNIQFVLRTGYLKITPIRFRSGAR
jgi:hypothetical protein